jgi:hypothetical protein
MGVKNSLSHQWQETERQILYLISCLNILDFFPFERLWASEKELVTQFTVYKFPYNSYYT